MREPKAEACRTFGDYELLEEIARGGMGIVYKARQKSLDRTVAVKLLLFGRYASDEFVHRFRIEASSAASLQHPNIVAIHEVGVHQDQHYFAMDFVNGPNLAQFVRNEPICPLRAARYAKTIADAIEFAHRRRIIHRDLKPSNVLIDSNDQLHVTDFGLARNLSEDSDLTLTGQVLGSPNYMPPEQASGQRHQTGPTADVYSIGAIVYHMLTGRPPFEGDTLSETIQRVLHQDPISPRLLNSKVPEDLETLCLKCLEKDPARRYPTAQALADELDRFIRDQPIQARPVTALERGWRWCRRNPAFAASVGTIVGLLLVVASGAPLLLWRVSQARRVAEENLYIKSIYQASEALDSEDLPQAQAIFQKINESAVQRELRGWEWRFLNHRMRSVHTVLLGSHPSWIADLAVTPEGDLIATISEDGLVKLWSLRTHQELTQWQAHGSLLRSQPDIFHHAVRFAGRGKVLISAGHDGKLCFWDLSWQRTNAAIQPQPAVVLQLPEPIIRLAVSPDENLLAGLSFRGELSLWSLANPKPHLLARRSEDETGLFVGFGLAFSFDSKELLAGSVDQPVQRYDVTDRGRLKLLGTVPGSAPPFAFSPDGHRLVSASASRRVVRRWSWPELVPSADLRLPSGNVDSFAFSSDNRWLAAGSSGGKINIWDENGRSLRGVRTLYGHEQHTSALYFLRGGDNAELVSISSDKTARLWNVGGEQPADILLVGAPVLAAAFSPDNRYLAAAVSAAYFLTNSTPAEPYVLQLWDLKSRSLIRSVFFGWKGRAPSLRFSPDGRHLAASDYSRLQFHEVPSLRRVATEGERGLVFSKSGDWHAYVNHNQIFRRSSLATMPSVLAAHPLGDEIVGTALADDDSVLASSSPTGAIYLWDPRNGRSLGIFEGHQLRIPSMLFSANGRRLVSACWDSRLGIWDLESRRNLAFLRAHHVFNGAAISPDGRTIATCGEDDHVRLWNLAYCQELAILRGHTGTVNGVAFSKDGQWLASCSDDGTVRLWAAPYNFGSPK